jgi:multidrug efflux system membrane fusion protein
MNRPIVFSVISLGAAALSLALLTGCHSSNAESPQGPPPPEVTVAEVVAREVVHWDEFSGRVTAVETVEVRPRVSGYLEQVAFTEGQEVDRGQVLFVIDPRPYRAEFDGAQAELERARTRAELARTEFARARKLRETLAISQEILDQRAAAQEESEAAIRAAEAAVETARLNLEFTEVRSPIAGRAGRAVVTEGNLVNTGSNGTLLTTVVSIDPVHVYFEGDEQTYLRYSSLARRDEGPGARAARTPVRVGLADEEGFPHQGTLDFVDNTLDPATGTITARAVLENGDRAFTPGLFARVQVRAGGERPALLIDERAVLTDQDRKYVYVLGADSTAQRRDVVLGRQVDGLREVNRGLAAGDQVIVHGVQKIFFPGMPVIPREGVMGEPPQLQGSAMAQADATGGSGAAAGEPGL